MNQKIRDSKCRWAMPNGKAKDYDIPKLQQQFEADRQFLNLILAMLDKIKISVKTHPESDRQREAHEIAAFKNRLLTLKRSKNPGV